MAYKRMLFHAAAREHELQGAAALADAVGDGTSTATILAHAMFADGIRNVVAGEKMSGPPETEGL